MREGHLRWFCTHFGWKSIHKITQNLVERGAHGVDGWVSSGLSVHLAVGSAVRAVGMCERRIHWPRFVPNLLGTNDRCRESVPTTLAAASLRQLVTRILFIAAESTSRVDEDNNEWSVWEINGRYREYCNIFTCVIVCVSVLECMSVCVSLSVYGRVSICKNAREIMGAWSYCV